MTPEPTSAIPDTTSESTASPTQSSAKQPSPARPSTSLNQNVTQSATTTTLTTTSSQTTTTQTRTETTTTTTTFKPNCSWPVAPRTPWVWDSSCKNGDLGCKADGIHIQCRFCGREPYGPCP